MILTKEQKLNIEKLLNKELSYKELCNLIDLEAAQGGNEKKAQKKLLHSILGIKEIGDKKGKKYIIENIKEIPDNYDERIKYKNYLLPILTNYLINEFNDNSSKYIYNSKLYISNYYLIKEINIINNNLLRKEYFEEYSEKYLKKYKKCNKNIKQKINISIKKAISNFKKGLYLTLKQIIITVLKELSKDNFINYQNDLVTIIITNEDDIDLNNLFNDNILDYYFNLQQNYKKIIILKKEISEKLIEYGKEITFNKGVSSEILELIGYKCIQKNAITKLLDYSKSLINLKIDIDKFNIDPMIKKLIKESYYVYKSNSIECTNKLFNLEIINKEKEDELRKKLNYMIYEKISNKFYDFLNDKGLSIEDHYSKAYLKFIDDILIK